MAILTLENLDPGSFPYINYTIFQNGRVAYYQKRAHVTAFDGQSLTCQVNDDAGVFTVTLSAESKQQIHAACDCGQAAKGTICRHVVASLFAAREYITLEGGGHWQYRLMQALESTPKEKTVRTQRARYASVMGLLRERYADDKVKQQQEMMEIYKKEKINPIAGCLPVALQIPVFFSLYKVLFVTIEMRHAPFFGWIKDLSAPDPTNLFTLFGLLHFDPTQLPVFGHYLALGIWPIIMGITMWFQMKLNPTPPDPTQQMIFAWMPLIFTFMLAGFPAGLVIYWAWNNLLSVLQQSFIMRRNGVKVELFDNIRGTFGSKKAESKT